MKKFFDFLRPFAIASSLSETEIIIKQLEDIKLVFIDVDNTLLSYRERKIPQDIKSWLNSIDREKIVVIITNNSKKRVRDIMGICRYNVICRAGKPLPCSFIKIMKKYNFMKDECIVIGDQLFDDVLGGKLAGIKTILTKPIDREKALRMKLKRYIESLILNQMRYI